MFRKNQLIPPHIARRKRRRFLIKLSIIFGALGLFIASVAYVSGIDSFTIKTISISGNNVVTDGEIKEYINKQIDGRYIGLFSRSNIFIYPDKHLERELLITFRRLKTISISRDGAKSIIVKIEERKPSALWCRLVQDAIQKYSDDCYFLDVDGFIFSRAPYFSDGVYVKYYGQINPVNENPIGSLYDPGVSYIDLHQFTLAFDNLVLKPLKISTLADGDFEILLVGGGKVYFNVSEGFIKVFNNLQALLAGHAELASEEVLSSLDYIDLRFGNRVFYKLKM